MVKATNKQDLLIKELAKKYNIDYRVCKAVVNSPFLYLKDLVTDDVKEEGIRIPYFGMFTQKGGYKNKAMRTEARKKILLENILEVTTMMATTQGFVVPSVESAKELIEKAWESGDYEKINFIWDGWKDYNKQ